MGVSLHVVQQTCMHKHHADSINVFGVLSCRTGPDECRQGWQKDQCV